MFKNFIGVTLFTTILLGASQACYAQAQNCRLASFGEIPVSRTPEGQALLAASLDGKPVNLAFNLNSPYSLISKSRVEGANLPVRSGGIALMASGRATNDNVATLGTLNLGVARFKNFEAFVVDEDLGDVYFSLGSGVIENFMPEFDLSHNVIRIFSKDHCKDNVVYWSGEYLEMQYEKINTSYLVNVKINGADYRATLSPGVPKSAISVEAEDSLGLHHQPGDDVVIDSLELGGIKLHKLAATDVLGLAAHKKTPTIVQFHANPRITQSNMIIGDDVLKHIRFIIDFESHIIYFTVS